MLSKTFNKYTIAGIGLATLLILIITQLLGWQFNQLINYFIQSGFGGFLESIGIESYSARTAFIILIEILLLVLVLGVTFSKVFKKVIK